MKTYVSILIITFLFYSCSNNPEAFVEHIEGYWEIVDVTKANNSIKSYNISTNVDYFKINNDLTGFRKKVKPSLDGTFTITQHESPFQLKIENNNLNIYYTVNNTTFKETIENASETELIITNDEGFKYKYKPFEKLTFE